MVDDGGAAVVFVAAGVVEGSIGVVDGSTGVVEGGADGVAVLVVGGGVEGRIDVVSGGVIEVLLDGMVVVDRGMVVACGAEEGCSLSTSLWVTFLKPSTLATTPFFKVAATSTAPCHTRRNHINRMQALHWLLTPSSYELSDPQWRDCWGDTHEIQCP